MKRSANTHVVGRRRDTGSAPKFNLNWQSFQYENASNGGYEIYRLISQKAVHDNGVVNTAAVPFLRAIDKTFKATIDPMIIQYMRETINPAVSHFFTALRSAKEHDDEYKSLPQRGNVTDEEYDAAVNEKDEWQKQKSVLYSIINDTGKVILDTFGYHTHATLKKTLSEFLTNHTSSYRHPGDGLGWVHSPRDVPRLGTTVHAYLAMAGPYSCELHAGKEICDCSRELGGGFAFVPNGGGLILHCCQSCMDEHTIGINPVDIKPIVCHWEPQPLATSNCVHGRQLQFAHAILMHLDIKPPFVLDHLRKYVGYEEWSVITNVWTALKKGHVGGLGMFADTTVRLLMLDTPTTRADVRHGTRAANMTHLHTPITFQRLFRFGNDVVADALQHVAESDRLDKELENTRRRVLKQHTTRQFDTLLRKQCSNADIPNTTLDDCDKLLPGVKQYVELAITTPLSFAHNNSVHEAHVMTIPLTSLLVQTCVLALGHLRRYDMEFSQGHASPHAYAYITGARAGFEIAIFNAQSEPLLLVEGVDRITETTTFDYWRTLVISMHVFDALDYESIRVTEMSYDERVVAIRNFHDDGHCTSISDIVFKWSFDVGGVRVEGPVIMRRDKAWYDRKIATSLHVLETHGYWGTFKIEAMPPPYKELDLLARNGLHDPAGGHTAALVEWIQNVAQYLCSRPETRSVGLDVLTVDSTRLFIKTVGNANLDAQTVAAAGVSMRTDEKLRIFST